MVSFSALIEILEHGLGIFQINKCLVAKPLLINVTQTNKHLNITTFVCTLIANNVLSTWIFTFKDVIKISKLKKEIRDCSRKEGNKYPIVNGYHPPAGIGYC